MAATQSMKGEKMNRDALKRARETYGNKNQITVAIEELCELSTVLAKYPRYEKHETAMDKIRHRVVEELADVVIVLDHVREIFEVDWDELYAEIDVKIERLERWLETSDSIEHTTVDRQIHKDGVK